MAVHAPHSAGTSGASDPRYLLALPQVRKFRVAPQLRMAFGPRQRRRRKGQNGTGTLTFDFIIFATGVETDLSARRELAPIVHHIALWRDRFTPPPGEESDLLARHPYLGTAFEFMEREPGTAPFLGRLHNFTFGAMPSLGLTGAAIPGMR